MRWCEKCGVRVAGSPSRCPLCLGPLTGEAGADAYPDIPFGERSAALRLCALATVIAGAACAAAALCLPARRAAALSCAAALAVVWLAAGIAVKKRGKPLKALFWQVCLLSLLALAWDRGTGGWPLDFALPALYICAMAAMVVTARLLRLRPADYLLYFVLISLLGLVPLVLALHGALGTVYPAALSAAASVILLAALALFQGPALKGELLRRFHL